MSYDILRCLVGVPFVRVAVANRGHRKNIATMLYFATAILRTCATPSRSARNLIVRSHPVAKTSPISPVRDRTIRTFAFQNLWLGTASGFESQRGHKNRHLMALGVATFPFALQETKISCLAAERVSPSAGTRVR
jgi:hypothetical protein